ncbi:MAG TPA: DUF1289 domain-containing protein [Burkholderiales bacterium]|nr:DUF1289 domain-containing protein [Burkholderiales bacterium]
MNDAAPKDVPSPCVNVCQMNPYNGLCRGCMRTIAEIAGWLDFTPAEKRAVLDQLEQRRRTGASR